MFIADDKRPKALMFRAVGRFGNPSGLVVM